MRSLLLFICLLTIFVGIQGIPRITRNEIFMNYLAECKKKVDATDADIEVIKNRQRLSTKTSQCLMACIKKKLGMMMEDNTMNLTATKEMIEPLKIQNKRMYDYSIQIIETCKGKEIPEKDECVAAKSLSDCIINIKEKDKMYD